jgi:squalene synthase HpnC
MKNPEVDLDIAYNDSIRFAKSHYENFPVISFLIPKHLRKHIAVIYNFARQADDIADEGNYSPEERINKMNSFEDKFNNSLSGNYATPFWIALANTINEQNLTKEYFSDLLKAFRQDIIKNRYKKFKEVLDYCKCSANPVGRLILELFDIRNDKIKVYSDYICTALQLTNFYQDFSQDLRKNRIYLPEDEIIAFNLSENDFKMKKNKFNFAALIQFQVRRVKNMFLDGYALFPHLPRRLKYEIGLTISGGEKILAKIEEINYNVLDNRPVLTKKDYFGLLIKTLKNF